MTQTEYEQKKLECWEEFQVANRTTLETTKQAFDYIFDRAYALGKVKDLISQDEIDKAAEDYVSFEKGGKCYPSYVVERACCKAFKDGANFALGKQEKDADTVIQGWVAIDEAFNECFLHTEKPTLKAQPIADTGDYNTVWNSKGKTYLLDTGLFPDMDSDSDPEPVDIFIKRKKNG